MGRHSSNAERDYTQGLWMLVAFRKLAYRMYEGTVPEHVTAQRRAENKVARKSRRINRRAR
jgi:hypothetical protein